MNTKNAEEEELVSEGRGKDGKRNRFSTADAAATTTTTTTANNHNNNNNNNNNKSSRNASSSYSSFTPPPQLVHALRQFQNRLSKCRTSFVRFVAPLVIIGERPWHRLTHYIRMYLHFIKVLIRSLYLPDELHFYTDSFIRLTFSVYYVPVIAAIIALTHSELQRIVWVLVVPVTQEMERQPYSVSSWYTLLNGVGDIFIKIIPFLALGMSVAVVGHKAINCVAEAMMDASITYEHRDYPLLHSRARYMCREKSRLRFFVVMLVIVCTLFLVGLHTNLLVPWGQTGTAAATATASAARRARIIDTNTTTTTTAAARGSCSVESPPCWNSTTTINNHTASYINGTIMTTKGVEETLAPSSSQVITYATWIVILVESLFVFFTMVHGAPPETLPASIASMSSRRHITQHWSYEMSESRSFASSMSNMPQLKEEQLREQVSGVGDGSGSGGSHTSGAVRGRQLDFATVATTTSTAAPVEKKPSKDYLGLPTPQALRLQEKRKNGHKGNSDNHANNNHAGDASHQHEKEEGALSEAERSITDSNYSIISSDNEREGDRSGPMSGLLSTQRPSFESDPQLPSTHPSCPPHSSSINTSDGEGDWEQQIENARSSSSSSSCSHHHHTLQEEEESESAASAPVPTMAECTAAALRALHCPEDNVVKMLPLRGPMKDHYQDNQNPHYTHTKVEGGSGTTSGSNTSRGPANNNNNNNNNKEYNSHFSDSPSSRRKLAQQLQQQQQQQGTYLNRSSEKYKQVLTPLEAAPPNDLAGNDSSDNSGLSLRSRKLRFSSPTSKALLDRHNHQQSVLAYLCTGGSPAALSSSSNLADAANRRDGNGGGGGGGSGGVSTSSYRVIRNGGYEDGYFGDEMYNFIIYVENDWWKHNIHFMRYIGFWLAILFGVLFTFLRSFSFGIGTTITMLLYLNVPHLLGYTTLAISHAALRCHRSVAWLLRHPDAVPPFLFLLFPYQLILLYTFYYFHHHSMTLLLLACVNVLLVARSIDLVRAFDTTAHGCVRWSDARTNRRLWPSLSMQLEDAYEMQYTSVEEVSLDLSFDITKMELMHGDQTIQLRRTQVIPYGAARFYLHSHHFYAYTIPRVLTFQTSASVGNHQVRVAKVVLRAITLTALLIFAGISCGMVMQAAFPQLRPVPVRVTVPDDLSRLSVNHLVAHLDIMTRARPATADERARLSTKWDAYLEAIPHGGRDLYPHLCQRTFHNTTSLELALLSTAAYLFNDDEVRTLVKFMNAHFHSDWELRRRHGASCIEGDSNHQPTNWRGFIELFSRERDLSVVAVRGTDMSSFTDFLIDVNLFLEMVLYQILAQIIPGAVLIPKELVADTLRILSMPPEDDGFAPDGTPRHPGWRETWHELTTSGNHSRRACQQNNYRRDYYVDAYNHVAYLGSRRHFREVDANEEEWGEDWRPSHVILTGHSLGGAVAAILAAQLDVPAVVFSAPGVALLRHKFGIALHKLHRNVVSVVSSHDIVPMIGTHAGEVQHLQCMAARKDLCHAVEFLIGALWRSCDSLRERFSSIEGFY